jgi:hypothetical protein
VTYFQVPLAVRPTGGGNAELVPPEALRGLTYRFVVVKDGGDEAIVDVDASTEALAEIARDKRCRRLSESKAKARRAEYPTPRLKNIQRGPSVNAGDPPPAAPEAADAERPVVETVQTVRHGFFLIDVPLGPAAAQ